MKKEELDLIKSHMIIKSPENLPEERRLKESKLDDMMATARQRKARMTQFDKLRETNLPKSDLQREKE